MHLILLLPLLDPRSAEASEEPEESEELVLIELLEPSPLRAVPGQDEDGLAEAEGELIGEEESRPEEPVQAPAEALRSEAEETVQEDRPDEEDEQPPPDSRDRRHVRFAEDQLESERAPKSRRIASKDVLAREETRAPKHSPVIGPDLQADLGAKGRTGSTADQPVKAPRSEDRAAESERRAEERAVLERPTPEEKRRSLGVDEAQPAQPGAAAGPDALAEREGGQEGSQEAGLGARAPAPASAGAPAAAVAGSEASAPRSDDGWEPFALRILPSEGAAAPTLAPSEHLTQPRDDDQPTLAQAAAQERETGAAGASQRQLAPPVPEAVDEAPALTELDEQEGDERQKTSAGWGGEAALSSQTRASATGSLSFSGAQSSTSPEVAELEVEEGEATQLSARAHEHGAYYDELHDVLRERWVELTPLEVRALGYQGTSVVLITVDAKGRVQDKKLIRRSGYSELDRIAMAAVPTRVGRPPRGMAQPTFTYEMDFRMTDRWAD